MGYSHISIKERELIYLLLEENLSYAAIGKILGRSKSTISREIKRNTDSDNYYSPSEATQKYKERRKNSHAKYRLDDQRLFRFIKNKIFNQQWSPEQIANRKQISYSKKGRTKKCEMYKQADDKSPVGRNCKVYHA